MDALEITLAGVAAYADLFTPETDLLLEQIARETEMHPGARMLSGKVQGRFLEFLSRLIAPVRILEIGTFVGYSALCLAKGLRPGGLMHTIEKNAGEAELARANFNRSNAGDKIILHHGNALDIIPQLQETWDLVFIDADKAAYESYYRLVFPAVRPGGLILADNVLFHGTVLDAEARGKKTLAIQRFNEMIRDDQSVDKLMIPLRDGLYLILKK
jgi:predicted O-methyltransferase YrrM